MIRRVNFYGGPGTGKSTMAMWICSMLKRSGRKVEYAHEFVKLWAYERLKITSKEQWQIFNEQERIEAILLTCGTETVISDSPLSMVCVYSKNVMSVTEQVDMQRRMQKHETKYPALNIFLERHPEKPYQTEGRWQSYADALAMDITIRRSLNEFNIPFVVMPAQAYGSVLSFVEAETK